MLDALDVELVWRVEHTGLVLAQYRQQDLFGQPFLQFRPPASSFFLLVLLTQFLVIVGCFTISLLVLGVRFQKLVVLFLEAGAKRPSPSCKLKPSLRRRHQRFER